MRSLRILGFGLAVSLVILGFRWWWNQPGPGGPAPEGPKVRNSGAADPDSLSPPRGDLPGSPLEPGQELPEVSLTDQRGREIRISDFRGNVLVLAFFYTHCELPSMCPLTTAKMAEASGRLSKRGRKDIRFLMVSFDPERDRPDRLHEYAARFETDPDRFFFATGRENDIRSLGRALNTYFRSASAGVIDHNISVSLFDRDGIFRTVLHGPEWRVDDLVAAAEALSDPPQHPGS